MTLPSSAYRDPSEQIDANRQQEKRDAERAAKMAERHRRNKSRLHRAQVKKVMLNGG